MALYHAQIYIPENIRLPRGPWALVYTNHAKGAAQNDRYGNIPLLPYLLLSQCELIEVEVDGSYIKKILYRMPWDAKLDMCFAVIPERSGYLLVKTVWFNQRSDKHFTLDRSKYNAK